MFTRCMLRAFLQHTPESERRIALRTLPRGCVDQAMLPPVSAHPILLAYASSCVAIVAVALTPLRVEFVINDWLLCGLQMAEAAPLCLRLAASHPTPPPTLRGTCQLLSPTSHFISYRQFIQSHHID
jgi:hypothetical protein